MGSAFSGGCYLLIDMPGVVHSSEEKPSRMPVARRPCAAPTDVLCSVRKVAWGAELDEAAQEARYFDLAPASLVGRDSSEGAECYSGGCVRIRSAGRSGATFRAGGFSTSRMISSFSDGGYLIRGAPIRDHAFF